MLTKEDHCYKNATSLMESSSPPPSPPPTLLWFTTHFYKKTLITPTPLDFPIISTAHELGINHCISGGCDSMWKLQRNRWVQLFTHGFPGCHTKFFMKKGIVSKLSITFLAHFMSLVSFYPPPPPWKHQKVRGFMFCWGIERYQRHEMG